MKGLFGVLVARARTSAPRSSPAQRPARSSGAAGSRAPARCRGGRARATFRPGDGELPTGGGARAATGAVRGRRSRCHPPAPPPVREEPLASDGGRPASSCSRASAPPSPALSRPASSRAPTAPRTHARARRSSRCSPSASPSTAPRSSPWTTTRVSPRSCRGSAPSTAKRLGVAPARRRSVAPGGRRAGGRGSPPPSSTRSTARLTGCAVAIAETGSFVLDGGPGQGRRALSLVPDLHVCVVRAEQVVGLVPEAVERLEGAGARGQPLTFVRPLGHLRHRAEPGRGSARSTHPARAAGGASGRCAQVYLGTSAFRRRARPARGRRRTAPSWS